MKNVENIQKQEPIKVGRLKLTIARKINRKCADIYLTPNYLKHIERRHKKELEKIGLSAIDFVVSGGSGSVSGGSVSSGSAGSAGQSARNSERRAGT